MNATKEFLFNIAIPLATDTYSPVSHDNIYLPYSFLKILYSL